MLLLITLLVLTPLLFALRPRRSLHFAPRYRQLLAMLATPEDVLDLPGVIVCGHPDRHVMKVTLPDGSDAFLKREHRVTVRDRLLNWWHGFGFVSKAERESAILTHAARHGIDAPEVLAFGEDGRGRAFLLVRALDGAVDLPRHARATQDVVERRRLAHEIGRTIARIHLAGLVHVDLYAKHVLIDDHETVVAIDWQRARLSRRIQNTWRDLAALDATMPEESASPRDRLRVLRSYLKTINEEAACRLTMRVIFQDVRKHRNWFLKRRHIQEQRNAPLTRSKQNLVWLDGEALCATPEFLRSLAPEPKSGNDLSHLLSGPHTRWLRGDDPTPDRVPKDVSDHLPGWLIQVAASAPEYRQESVIELPSGSLGILRSRQAWRPMLVWDWLRGRAMQSRDLALAALTFRLERHGVPVPKLLAVGQRALKPWRWSSFHLVELPAERMPLPTWLGDPSRDVTERRAMLRKVGVLLRRLHDARCHFTARTSIARVLGVAQSGISLRLMLTELESIRTMRREQGHQRRRDLLRMSREITALGGSRTDVLRFLHGYVQHDPLRGREDLPMLLFAASLLQGRLAA